MTGRSIGLASASTLVAALLVPVNLGAQTFDRSDAVGRKVRVVATDGSRATGRVVSLSDTEVVIRRDGNEQRLALSKVERVERVRHHARNLAVWGALAGAVVGGLVGAANTRTFRKSPRARLSLVALGQERVPESVRSSTPPLGMETFSTRPLGRRGQSACHRLCRRGVPVWR